MSKYFHRKNSTVTRPASLTMMCVTVGEVYKQSVKQAHGGTTPYDTTFEVRGPWRMLDNGRYSNTASSSPISSATTLTPQICSTFYLLQKRPMKGHLPQMNVGDLVQDDERLKIFHALLPSRLLTSLPGRLCSISPECPTI